MTFHKYGGPAFPYPASELAGSYETHPGMDLRDYFAGACLTGVLANPADDRKGYAIYAERAYKMADAMLAAREVKQ